MTCQELRDKLPPGYGSWATIVPAAWSWDIEDFAGRAFPILREADTFHGALRCLDHPGRFSGIMKAAANSGADVRMIWLRWCHDVPMCRDFTLRIVA